MWSTGGEERKGSERRKGKTWRGRGERLRQRGRNEQRGGEWAERKGENWDQEIEAKDGGTGQRETTHLLRSSETEMEHTEATEFKAGAQHATADPSCVCQAKVGLICSPRGRGGPSCDEAEGGGGGGSGKMSDDIVIGWKHEGWFHLERSHRNSQLTAGNTFDCQTGASHECVMASPAGPCMWMDEEAVGLHRWEMARFDRPTPRPSRFSPGGSSRLNEESSSRRQLKVTVRTFEFGITQPRQHVKGEEKARQWGLGSFVWH